MPFSQKGISSISKFIFSLALLTICVSDAVNYAPPPQINISQILQLSNSAVGSRFIGSKRIEALQVVQSGSQSTFTLTFFNRSAPGNVNTYTYTQNGSWTYLKGTTETLSCNLMYDSISQRFALLQFLNDVGVFKFYTTFSLAALQQALSSNYNYTQIADLFTVGQNCQIGQLSSSIYRFSPLSQSLNVISLPSGWIIQAVTQSFEYGISKNNLYRFNQDLNQYDLIKNLDPYSSYKLQEKGGRIIITAANGTYNSSLSKYQVSQRIYFLEDQPSGLVQITTADFNGYNDLNFIPIFRSPQMTKMGFGYSPIGSSLSSQVIVAKSIDYIANIVIDLIWTNPQHYLATSRGMNSTEFDFSDYFLAVRNVSGALRNPSLNAVEEAYQFNGNKITFFNSRILNGTKEMGNWSKIFVDLYYPQTLVVLDVYYSISGFDVDEVRFGSYADTTRVIPPQVLPYIQFLDPINTFKQPLSNNLAWTYYDVGSTTTNLTVITHKKTENASGNYAAFSNTLTGKYYFLNGSANCRLLKENSAGNKYYIYQFSIQANNYSLIEVTSFLTGVTINASTNWYVSQRCDRFAVGLSIFYRTNANSYSLTQNNYSSFAWNTIDANLTFVVVGSAIWKFNPSLSKFVQTVLLQNPGTTVSITTVQNRIIVTGVNATSSPYLIKGFVFLDQNGGLTSIANYSQAFISYPKIGLSQQLSKAYIYGSMSAGSVTVDTYFIDYSKKQVTNITFPIETIREVSHTSVSIFQKFIYVRQIFNTNQASNTTYTSVQQQEFVYYLSQDIIPQLLLQRNISQSQALVWQKSRIISNDDQNYQLAVESYQNNTVTVVATQLNIQQAKLNSGNNKAISGYVNNGVIVLCPPGCADCSTAICTGCVTGYAFSSNSALCLKCPPGCSSCDSSNLNSCSACFNGTYLSGSACFPCDPTCITCSTSATSCLNCFPGQYYSTLAGQCMLCPRNCISCVSQASCSQCRKGFTVTPAGTCRGCSMSCSDCNPYNITQCTSCAQGLQLVGSQCIQCPSNCLVCNNGICQTCINGYATNSAGVCVLNCQLPCATCVDNQPLSCTSCFSSSILSGSTCLIDSSCNNTASCTDCGQGLGYYLDSSICYPCSLINHVPHCIQCSQINQQLCSICQDGFYLNSSGLCPACPSNCITCVGATLCTSCQIGYTLPSDQTQAQCLLCQSPCATCSGAANYCNTCINGFTKSGWKCQNNTYVGFSVTLSGTGVDASQVLNNIDSLIASLLTLMSESTSNVDAITIKNVIQNSVSVSGSASPSAGVGSGSTGLSAGFASGSIAGYTITASSVVVNGDSGQSSSTNLGMIIGLAVGLTVFIVVLIIIICCVYKQKKDISSRKIRDASEIEINMQDSREPLPQSKSNNQHLHFQFVQLDKQI